MTTRRTRATAKRSERVTIGDVASEARVSVATVSRVVNGRYGVSPRTISRVREVIAELGYESSLAARSMRSERTGVIGVLVPGIDPFNAEVLKGVSEALQRTGCELMVFCPADGAEGWERSSITRLGGTLVDGMILITPTVVDVATSQPVVAVDPHVGASQLPTVDAENHDGASAATRHLVELGHRRIGFLGGRHDLESARNREHGYRHALNDAGLLFDPVLVQNGDYTDVGARAPARTLLSLADRPTAIFAANDQSALEVVRTARALGLGVPGDLSVVGFDNTPDSALCDPPLTTVDQSLQDMGREAVQILVSLVEQPADDRPEPVHVRLPTELVVRHSTGPPRPPTPAR